MDSSAIVSSRYGPISNSEQVSIDLEQAFVPFAENNLPTIGLEASAEGNTEKKRPCNGSFALSGGQMVTDRTSFAKYSGSLWFNRKQVIFLFRKICFNFKNSLENLNFFEKKFQLSWYSHCIADIMTKGVSIVQKKQVQNALLLPLNCDVQEQRLRKTLCCM